MVLKNVALFPLEKDKIDVLCADVTKTLRIKGQYDLIFSDAPYDHGLNEEALKTLASKGNIAPGAICVIETRHNEGIDLPPSFELFDERVYGMAKMRLYTFCS